MPIVIPSVTFKKSLSDCARLQLERHKRLNELGEKLTDERAKLEEEIRETDKKIDALVYELYGLTDEEIRIVEEILK
ncbi:MAG: hypothetical protein ACP5E4_04130 [Candidatus Aenigmatarchaeota archaeon]